MTTKEMEIQIHQFAEMMYRTGYEDGQKDWHNVDEEREKAYKQGLNDAWDCARKIVQTSRGYSHDEINEIYGTRLRAFDLTPSEAIAKMQKYEEAEQKILKSCDIKFRVGDIVILNRDVCGYKNAKGSKGIIEKIAFDDGIKEEKAFVNFVGGLNGWYRLRYLTNTGKHYPLIKEILAEIRGENNDN